MPTPACSCEISDILSYDGDGTLTIKGDLVVEGKTNSPAAEVLNGLCADPTVEVEVVAEEPPPGGLAAVPSLYSIHLSREVL